MTNHPNRGRKPNLVLVENGVAYIVATFDGDIINEFETCRLHEGRYIRIDDGKQYPQLCADASLRGATLEYSTPAQLARDCNARLFKTRARFEATRDALRHN
jgi:hypothetical protein